MNKSELLSEESTKRKYFSSSLLLSLVRDLVIGLQRRLILRIQLKEGELMLVPCLSMFIAVLRTLLCASLREFQAS